MPTTARSQVDATSGAAQANNQPIRLVEFASALKAHRRREGLTLTEAADATGISAATLSRIERAKFHPRFETAHALCAWMGVPLSEFATSQSQDQRDTLEKVETHFRADAKLSPEAAEEIMGLIRGLYQVKTQQHNGRTNE